MTGAALALVLGAAVVHAGWNLAAKRVPGGGAIFVFLYYTVSAVVCLPLAIVVLMQTPGSPQWTWLFASTVTALLHVVYGVVLQRGYAVGDHSVVYPLARGTGPPVVYFGAAALLQSALLAPFALRDASGTATLWRTHRREVLLVGVLSPVAYLLVLFALRIAPVSLVAPARELSIVLGGLAAWRVLGEAEPVRRIAGSGIVLAGITAIAFA
ncbi:EamA-like transporter family protein [Amycolatopsis marina]|uniref:EamA-like transporter family protein n=1 Tax=Amycolatopsis marina TaxID=490629 RepID=A0A1I0ZP39_9PSEU|nr:EamA family transporter [Amycolatopsis marina]SFB27484.1 EamA-like transporter family protein [Amycolatopsis marina]